MTIARRGVGWAFAQSSLFWSQDLGRAYAWISAARIQRTPDHVENLVWPDPGGSPVLQWFENCLSVTFSLRVRHGVSHGMMTRVPIFRRDGDDLRRLGDDEVLERYRAVDTAWDADDDPDGRALAADRLAAEIVRRRPEAGAFWYDRGMLAKWRGDWDAAVAYNRRALDLLPPGGREGEPEAWNLGIAATALEDWPTTRAAWAAFGITLPATKDDSAPIQADFGLAPVRLNPHPRFAGQRRPVLDGREWDTEVVWGRRLCPARIRIESVPTPESGHRYGDVVLHDGDTVGSRRIGDAEVGVFNEIAVWQRASRPTLSAVVEAPDAAAVAELADRFETAGGAAEDWTANLQMLCTACSEGAPAHDHSHAPATGWSGERHLGIAATPEQAQDVLARWSAAAPGRAVYALDVALR